MNDGRILDCNHKALCSRDFGSRDRLHEIRTTEDEVLNGKLGMRNAERWNKRPWSVVEPQRDRPDLDQGVVSPVNGRVPIAGNGADFIKRRLVGEVDGEQFRFQ